MPTNNRYPYIAALISRKNWHSTEYRMEGSTQWISSNIIRMMLEKSIISRINKTARMNTIAIQIIFPMRVDISIHPFSVPTIDKVQLKQCQYTFADAFFSVHPCLNPLSPFLSYGR